MVVALCYTDHERNILRCEILQSQGASTAKVGTLEIVVILIVALLAVGPERLPKLARSLGSAVRGFKKYMSEATGELMDSTSELKEVSDELKSTKKMVTDVFKDVGKDMEEVGKDTEKELKKTEKVVKETVESADPDKLTASSAQAPAKQAAPAAQSPAPQQENMPAPSETEGKGTSQSA